MVAVTAAVASPVLPTTVTAAVASPAPAGRVARLVVAFACVRTYAFLWLATSAVHQRVRFRTSPDGAAGTPPPEADGASAASSRTPVRR